MGRRIEAVVFDLDNTLVDSGLDFGEMRKRVGKYIRSQYPGLADGEEPRTTFDLIENLQAQIKDKRQLLKHMKRIHKIMDRVEMESVGRIKPLADVRGILSDLKAMGIKIGLLTRSCESYARAAIASIGCQDAFDAVACRSAARPAKPSPASLANLAMKLGVDVQRVLLVGDHVMDGECARSAGALFAGVTTGSSPASALREACPIALLQGLGELPELVRSLNESRAG